MLFVLTVEAVERDENYWQLTPMEDIVALAQLPPATCTGFTEREGPNGGSGTGFSNDNGLAPMEAPGAGATPLSHRGDTLRGRE